MLETQVYGTIANDYQAAIASINVGEPLVLSKNQSRVIQDFGNLASKLSGIKPQNDSPAPVKPQRSGWTSIFGNKR